MPYAFDQHEPLSAAIPRLMLEQIERAAGHLNGADETPEKRVHNARKRIKETRAVLRLVRGPLGEGPFALENAWYRDAARDLASARDEQAVLEALEKLELDARARKHARKVLERRKSAPADLQGRIDNAVAQLDAARNRIATWPEFGDGFGTVGEGLRRIYGQGRQAMRLARAEPTPHNLHEWRKRVKDQWYHVQLVRPMWPEVLKANAQALAALSEQLGDHHDLHVLEGLARSFGKYEAAVREAMEKRLAELELSAFALGARVFAEKPSAWHDRMRALWRVWRK